MLITVKQYSRVLIFTFNYESWFFISALWKLLNITFAIGFWHNNEKVDNINLKQYFLSKFDLRCMDIYMYMYAL